ncbi:MAG: GerAB/ArcD/ProY family transporter [Thermoflavifilum sp.]|nr:GerAB/ArcD/ProY family transporter [Thermoflavifilum sp.]MCL6514204.1 spore germination protein [Alicyclobacillus sp.]
MQMVQNKARVGGKELTAAMTLLVASHTFLIYPQYASRYGLEASWMAPIEGAIVSLVLFLLLDALIFRFFPGQDLIEIAQTALGTFGGVLVALLLALYFLFVTASVLREFVENVLTTVLPSTPILVATLLFMMAVGYFAYLGLEGIVRTAFFTLPILLVGVLGLCLLTMNWWHPILLFPILGSGIPALTLLGLRTCSLFTNVLLLSIIYKHAHDPHELRRVGINSTLLAALVLSAFLLTYHMVFAEQSAVNISFPFYQLARLIYIGRFIQRMESIFVFLWVAAALIVMAVLIWGAAYVLSVGLRWSTFRPGVPALTLLCLAVGLIPASVTHAIQFDYRVFLPWGWTMNFVFPILVVLVARMRTPGRAHRRRRVA